LPAATVDPLIPDSLLRTILGELSADNALKQTAAISSHARYPNSQGFFDAAEYVAARAREYGLQNVQIERLPASQAMWDAEEARLEVAPPPGSAAPAAQIPSVLAQHSADADVTAQLVDADAGVPGDKIRGNVLLTHEEPDVAWRKYRSRGPAAVISDAVGEYFGRRTLPGAIFWGMVSPDVVGLMISPQSGESLRAELARGPVKVLVHAKARRVTPGAIGIVMGEIPGAVNGQDIVIAAHLDHQFPGANDNGSGSGTLLELARAATSLISTGKIPKPHRTIRFWWTTEIVSEQAWFRKHPEEAKRILLSIVLDQAGGERNAENNLILIANPDWLPSYTDDLIENLAEFVKNRYAPAEHEPDPLLIAGGGSHQSLRTVYWEYQPITDEVAFEARDIRIPGISIAVPSLDLIHTDLDTVDRLDPTWMKRTALLTLAPALYVANAGPAEARAVLEYTFQKAAARLAVSDNPAHDLPLEQKRLDSVRALDPAIDTGPFRARLTAVAQALAGPAK
jgi:Peptidase family M28